MAPSGSHFSKIVCAESRAEALLTYGRGHPGGGLSSGPLPSPESHRSWSVVTAAVIAGAALGESAAGLDRLELALLFAARR